MKKTVLFIILYFGLFIFSLILFYYFSIIAITAWIILLIYISIKRNN